MKLVIAEKPSVAREIGTILNATKSGDGYISGNGYTITWAYGHLVGLSHAKEYGYESWNLEKLPIIPNPFNLTVNTEGSSKKQFNTIKKLLHECDELIVATDAGREGELIFRYIYQASGCEKPFKRLWIASLTKVAIQNGFKNLQPGTNFDNTYYAAKCRNESDWLVGINATVAFTVASGSGKTLSLGRVQTPVLAMICSRFIENKSFQPQDYFVPTLQLKKQLNFKAFYTGETIFNKPEAQKIISKVGDHVQCTSSETKPRTEKQPLLYHLTSLQADANKKYGLSAKATLKITQSLYEKKWVTYPRTDSRYLTSDIYDVLNHLFTRIKNKFPQYTTFIDKFSTELPKRSINDKKVSDHHAIIPTGEKNGELDTDEQHIFDMIIKRTIASFSDVCQKEVTTYIFNDLFKASGTTIINPGWRAIESESSKNDDESSQLLPSVDEQEEVEVISKLVESKKTKPKPLHTEASLLTLMETAAKEIDDEELAQAIKDSGIGTPATRDSIIEKLIAVSYIGRSKRKLLPTELGLSVYNQVKDLPIASPELTGAWEKKLSEMALGNYSPNDFKKEIELFTTDLLPKIIDAAKKVDTQTIKAKCPKCKEGNISESKLFFGCSEYQNGCDFKIWKIAYGKTLSLPVIQSLIETGEYNKVLKGFKNKDKEPMEGKLKLDENFTVRIVFADKPKPTGLTCPKCNKGEIKPGKSFYGCSEYQNGCDFKIWNKISEKKITLSIVKDLVEKGRTEKMNGFKKFKSKEPFKANMILSSETGYEVKFEF